MLPGVRPSIACASAPTFSSRPVFLSIATTDGSFSTTPLPLIYTKTEAVPRSIPISFAKEHIAAPHPFLICMIEYGKLPIFSQLRIILTALPFCKSNLQLFTVLLPKKWPALISTIPQTLPVYSSRVMASVRHITSAAPASFSTRAHSPSVAPVVQISSTRRSRFPANCSGDTAS